jgi:hypothetical protein
LNKLAPPIESAKSGLDYLCCGDCKHRPVNFGTCYVTFIARTAIYKAWRRGRYAKFPQKDYQKIFGARDIRCGAYGDPALVPPAYHQSFGAGLRPALQDIPTNGAGYRNLTADTLWLLLMLCPNVPQQIAKAIGHSAYRAQVWTMALMK